MAYYCKNCGLELDYQTNFCPNCGTAVGIDNQVDADEGSGVGKTIATVAGAALGISLLKRLTRNVHVAPPPPHRSPVIHHLPPRRPRRPVHGPGPMRSRAPGPHRGPDPHRGPGRR